MARDLYYRFMIRYIINFSRCGLRMQKIKNIIKILSKHRSTILVMDVRDTIFYMAFLLILAVAFIVRTFSARYGIFIDEFDPYFQYYATKVVIDGITNNGLQGLLTFFDHSIDLTWYPYGVDMGQRYYPGVPYIGAFTYLFLSALGLDVSLYSVAVYLPVLFGIFSTVLVYKIAYKITESRYIGLFSALFYTLTPSVILRSDLGWYDTDGLGMPLFLLSIYLFIKSLDSSRPYNKAVYAFMGGVSAGILGATWGIHQYVYILIALFAILVVILDIEIPNFEVTYFPFVTTAFIILSSIPVIRYSYIFGVPALVQYLAIVLVLLRNYNDPSLFTRYVTRTIGVGGFLGVLALISISLIPDLGLPSRQIIVLLPFMREAFIVATTVQEQLRASYFTYFRDLHILTPFVVGGFYVAIKRWRDPKYLLLLLLVLTSLYASSTFVRLTILFNAFAIILSALAFFQITKFFVSRTNAEKFQFKMYTFSFVLIFIILSTSLVYIFSIQPLSRTTVALISHGTQFTPSPVSYDWLQALEWIKNNVGDNEVIASWWDYGYWISFIAGKKSLADNGTLNSTRIQELAEMFMSTDELISLEALRKMNASYILVYLGVVPLNQDNLDIIFFAGTGEDGKFVAIAKIAGVNRSILLNQEDPEGPRLTDTFWNTFLGRLIPYEFQGKQNIGAFTIDVYRYLPKYPEGGDRDAEDSPLVLVFRSTDPAPGEVIIYKINYDYIEESD